MYLAHFGLTEAPFSITPDTRFLYLSERHRDGLAHLLYGIDEGGGFVQLTGEVGTGKTTLCRRFLDQAPPHVDAALILNPRLTGPELLAAICDELGLSYPPAASAKLLVDTLHRHLLDAHARGRRTVLVIDEAQDLAPEVLEDVRLLTNLETAREKLLQIILIGQPELGRMLDRDDLRQVAQRITARHHLMPFSPDETRAYIRHRLGVAGVKWLVFAEAAMREVHRVSGGVPRLINIVCDRALLGAYAEDRHQVDRRIVRRAAREALAPRRRGSRRPWFWVPAAAGAAAIALGAVVTAWPDWPSRPSVPGLARVSAPAANDPSGPPANGGAAGEASVGTPASPHERPGPAGALGEALADPSIPGDRGTAFASLYALWGLHYDSARDGPGCDHGRSEGLRCLPRAGSWERLRRFGMPAILELETLEGDRRYATVAALGDDDATLLFGERRLAVARTEVDAHWNGSFTLLWRAPALAARILAPGARGRDVAWLRQRLDELSGHPARVTARDVYDEELRSRVVAFQRRNGLAPDGVAGEETLARLVAVTGDSWTPGLGPVDPGRVSRAGPRQAPATSVE